MAWLLALIGLLLSALIAIFLGSLIALPHQMEAASEHEGGMPLPERGGHP